MQNLEVDQIAPDTFLRSDEDPPIPTPPGEDPPPPIQEPPDKPVLTPDPPVGSPARASRGGCRSRGAEIRLLRFSAALGISLAEAHL